MIDKIKVEEIVKEVKPNVKAKSRSVYVLNIMRIMNKYENKYEVNISNINNFLDDIDKIKEILPQKISTKKNYLMSLLILLKSNDKYKELYDEYLKYTHEIIEQNDKIRNSQEKSESQKKNWVSWDKVEGVLKDLKAEVSHYKISKLKNLNSRNKLILQDYLLLSLYVHQAPRRSVYSNMKIITEAEYKGLSNDERRENNWLVVNKRNKKKYFILTVFKTERSQGLTKIDITKKMNRVLNIVLKFLDTGDWLLTNRNGGKMTSNSLTKHLVRILKPTGKRISINMLRHLYATKHSPARNVDYENLKAEADKLGHSIEQHIKYIKK